MSEVIVLQRFRLRRDTAANWIANNPTPLSGEPCLETDTGFRKTGDGVTAWIDLDYDDASRVPFDGNSSNGLGAGTVQEAIDELADEKLDDAPSDGKTYGREDGAWVEITGGGGGGGAMELVGTYTVAGSAVTTINIPSLDLSAAGTYILEVNAKNNTATNGYVNLYFNGDTTATNYENQSLTGSAGTVGANRLNNAQAFHLYVSATAHATMEIVVDLDGKASVISKSRENTGAALVLRSIVLTWLTAANVTSIDLTAAVANAFAVGSYAKLWKRS